MGQANSSRERHKSGDIQPCSPGKDGQAFVFDKKPNKLLYQTSGDDDDYLNAKVCHGSLQFLNAKNITIVSPGF
jgi:5'-AMP-activated protein kinase regulatory beta subunit